MSQLTFNAQHLANALSQLAGTSKPVGAANTAQTIPVQISFAGSQQLTLLNTRTQQTTVLPRQTLQGNIQPGTTYLAQTQSASQGGLLNLFPANQPAVSLKLGLSQQQFEQILRLPPGQVLPSDAKSIEVKAQITDVSARQIAVQISGSKQVLTLPLPASNLSHKFTVGQPVTISLQSAASQWQLQIASKSTPPVLAPLFPAKTPAHAQLITQLIALSQKPLALNQNIKPQLASWLGIKPDSSNSPITLALNQEGKATVSVFAERPVAAVKVDQASLSKLLPNAAVPSSDKPATKADVTAGPSALTAPVSANKQDPNTQPHISQTTQHVSTAVKEAVQTLQRLTLPHTQPPAQTLQNIVNILSDTTALKDPEVKSVLANLLKILRPTSTIASANTTVTPVGKVPIENTPIGKPVVEAKGSDSVSSSIIAPPTKVAESPVTPTPSDVIRQTLTFPALAVNATSLANNTVQPGILGGLVALLQLTLTSRISRPSMAIAEQTQQLIASLFPTAAKPTQRTGRPLSDLAQLEQKHGLIKEIGKLLATHQHFKLSSAEAAMQNQETFYYVLPNLFAGQQRDIELLVRREQPKQENEQGKQKSGTCWHLTMKLDVGDTGQLLSKAKLSGDNLEVDFYTSNDQTLLLVRTYLPLLKRRLDMLGINVDKAQSQLGKIPESLQQRPYHIFETRA